MPSSLHRRVSAVSTLLMLPFLLAPAAQGTTDINLHSGQDGWSKSNEVPAGFQGGTEKPGEVSPQSASGTTPAPGGNLASVSIYVNGAGTYVEDASVSYINGTDIAGSNPCVNQFEIAYYEGGIRKVETGGAQCSYLRPSHQFVINRGLDPHTPFCGRVQIGSDWSNYACVDILP